MVSFFWIKANSDMIKVAINIQSLKTNKKSKSISMQKKKIQRQKLLGVIEVLLLSKSYKEKESQTNLSQEDLSSVSHCDPKYKPSS